MLKKEWQAILKHKFFLVIMVVLALVPALYNWIFLSSMWNPYGHLQDLPVAVVNLDKSSELSGGKLNLGKDVVKEMKSGKELDYHFVSKEKAAKGMKNGDYYVVVTFPKNFSSHAASLMSSSPKQVTLNYQTSQGHNYISSKMGESAMAKLEAEVSKNITEKYTQAIFDNMSTLKSGMNQASDGADKLSDGSSTALTGSKTLSENLTKLSKSTVTFSDGAKDLNVGVDKYLSAVTQVQTGAVQLANGSNQFSAATEQLAAGTQTLTDKSKDISDGLSKFSETNDAAQKLQTASQQLLDGLTTLSAKTTLSASQKSNIATLQSNLTQLNQSIQDGTKNTDLSTDLTKQLNNVSSNLKDLSSQQAEAVMKLDLTAAQKTEVLNALQQSSSQNLQSVQTSLNAVAADLTTLQAQTQTLATAANQVLPGANEALTTLSNGMNQVNTAMTGQVLPGMNQLNTGLTSFHSVLQTGTSQLDTGFGQFSQALNQANSGAQQLAQKSETLKTGSNQLATGLTQLQGNNGTLTQGSNQLAQGASQLASGSKELSAGGNSLENGLSTINTGANHLAGALTGAKNGLSATNTAKINADSIARPLKVSHTDRDNTANNGVGMAPYMIAVALFVGAISTNIMLGTSLSHKQWKNGRDFILAKIGTNGVIAVGQALIVTGAVYALGLRANYGWGMLFGTILISLSFMALVTFLNMWLGKVGAFVSLVLLIVQLAASAGTYPLQLTAKVFQVINPWIPMTYAIRLLRQVISLQGNVGIYVLILGMITIIFTAGLGLFGKKVSI
ncbi:YhgE/Pip family protein [Lactococcus nasutitermitis]|uniref:YhgE/Pip family protein n=1 Tax=Lactococcus nasutitermitis TaxID=1652957 RepID=A0ABV9JFS1_9LACT|nr:YhgE/Pip domain-containing protein [Lactococcus nasutitermitis]